MKNLIKDEPNKKSICIVGAGIVGVSAAYQLQKHGFNATLIDKSGVSSGASYGNAGHFATEQVFPLADFNLLLKLPKMLLDPKGPIRIKRNYFFQSLPWFFQFVLNMLPRKREQNAQAIRALNAFAISELKKISSEVGRPDLIKLNGNLLVFEKTLLSSIVKEWRAYSDAGVATRLISGDEARRLEPSLSNNISHALYFTETGHTPDPEAFCLAIFEKFISMGGQFHQCVLEDVKASSVVVSFEDELEHSRTLSFDKLLISAGAWSKNLLSKVGHNVPLDTERGYHLMTPQHCNLTRPVASFERKFIITPMEKGTRLAGIVEFGGLENPATKGCSQRLKAHSQEILNELRDPLFFENAKEWMGFRPSLPDSLPVISATKNKNIYASFGHQHLGLTWSAISAKLITQKIMEKEPDIDISPYRVDRF